MKLKDGLILREVAGQYVIVPTGKRVQEVLGIKAAPMLPISFHVCLCRQKHYIPIAGYSVLYRNLQRFWS